MQAAARALNSPKLARSAPPFCSFLGILGAISRSKTLTFLQTIFEDHHVRFPMIWWLSRLINEELDREEEPLAQEIRSWVKERAKVATEMQARGESIRQLTR
jgi:hypothetical protein